jgi:hypothetical protein
VVSAYRAVGTRQAVSDTIAGHLPRGLDAVDLAADKVVPAASGTFHLTVPIETTARTPTALQLAKPGLYPITVDLQSSGTTVAELITFVHRLPGSGEPAQAPLAVAMAVSTTAPVEMDATGTVTVGEAAFEELTRLADVLQASAIPVTISVPPATIAALTNGGADRAALATRLSGLLLRNSLLSAPRLPLDPSAAAADNQQALYTQWLRDGEDTLTRTLNAGTLRTVAAVRGPLSAAGGNLLRNLGANLLVLPTALYDGLPDTLGVLTDNTQLVQLQVAPGVTLDATVVDRVAGPALAGPTTEPALTAVYTVADLLGVRQQVEDGGGDPTRHSLTMATPDLGLPPAQNVAVITTLVAATPGLRATTFDDLAVHTDRLLNDGTEVVVGLPDHAGGDLSARTSKAAALGLEALSTGSMLATDDPRLAQWSQLIGVLPTDALSDAQVSAINDGLHAQYAAIRSAVEVPTGFSFNLTGRNGTVRIKLRNTATIPLQVRVRMTSSKLLFPRGDQTVTLDPQSLTEVAIPIEARSNGRFPVTLQVFTPTGDVELAQPVPLTASVNALAGLGNLVTGAALLVLLTWWIRHMRRSRRQRAAAAAAGRHPVSGVEGAANPDPDLSPDAATSTLPPS